MTEPMLTGATALTLRARGDFASLDAATRRAITDRTSSLDATIGARTAAIIDDVRLNGDEALRRYARDFDGATLTRLEVPRERWIAALDALDPALRRSLERARLSRSRSEETSTFGCSS
mgnify:FL=1